MNRSRMKLNGTCGTGKTSRVGTKKSNEWGNRDGRWSDRMRMLSRNGSGRNKGARQKKRGLTISKATDYLHFAVTRNVECPTGGGARGGGGIPQKTRVDKGKTSARFIQWYH